MSKQEREYKVPQTEVAGLKAVFASVIMAACLAFDLFAMINLASMTEANTAFKLATSVCGTL